MNQDMVIAVIKRFGRTFLAAGFAQMATVITLTASSKPGFQSLQELKTWLMALLISGFTAFIAGGLSGLDKAIRWKDAVQDPQS